VPAPISTDFVLRDQGALSVISTLGVVEVVGSQEQECREERDDAEAEDELWEFLPKEGGFVVELFDGGPAGSGA
jgi:hypothetical protein